MKIFVTGGTGFIGKFVISKLKSEKNKLLILTRNLHVSENSKNTLFVKGDLSDVNQWKDELKKFMPDAAIHLAWEGIPDYSSKNSIKNLNFSLELVQLLAEIGCKKILATGTLWEYGDQSGKLSEDMQIKPFNAFTAAKNALNWLGSEIAKERDISFTWIRLFYVYGPGLKRDSLIPYLIKCGKENKKAEIRNLYAQNDFVYVEDVADAICTLLLKCKKGGVYNIGSGQLTSVQTIIEKIFNSFSKQKKYKKTKKKNLDSLAYAYADISKIQKFGWKPRINIEEGLRKTIEASLN
ncbi:hypothetical protein A3C59_00500 [Candidatus Daviesbacteria bacterium RIFCSPHIGHO2_02_FULL_36_13]|uniref:NAD-dependent epimerase/dehydratase domain-containing protein n=1 Tax=Candidatus Daviesbacteria bacterium RIFCSPHIGHO2_02_FULL_36_13 TaxID=1797768 RepID=A0A1F5JPT6_9BACT|nr:MAG: hypothetical protein A3C59_00500 [Candidatus Daviesbacteria bacterium RIFCSPHIGHO2_02_FULL_36_13]